MKIFTKLKKQNVRVDPIKVRGLRNDHSAEYRQKSQQSARALLAAI